MNITTFRVTENQLSRTSPPAQICAGSIGTHAVQIAWEPATWASLSATAVFKAGQAEYTVPLLDRTAACEIPAQAMANAGVPLWLGVFVVDSEGELVLPTTYAKLCDTVQSGANTQAAEAEAPTQSVYAQWVADISTAAASAQTNAESAAQSVATVRSLADAVDTDFSDATSACITQIETASEAKIALLQGVAAKTPTLSEHHTWLLWDTDKGAYLDTDILAKGEPGEKGADGAQGAKGDKGENGADGAPGADGQDAYGFAILDRYDTLNDLYAAHPSAQGGDAYFVSADGENLVYLWGQDAADYICLGSLRGVQGEKGEKGDPGTNGTDGAAFTYADFTEAQLAALKGEQGEKGEKGDTGDPGTNGTDGINGTNGADGANGAAFTYADFTEAQLAALKGAQGEKGDKGDTGDPGTNGTDGINGTNGADGADGAAFTYADFTEAQLAALKGEQGEKGDKGDTGDPGADGADGAQGTPTTVNGLSGASITLCGADLALTGYATAEAGSVAATDSVNQAIAKLEASNAANGIATYTHATEASTHTLMGSGANGKFKASANGTVAAFTIGGSIYTVVQGEATQIALTEGHWYPFILDADDATINFTNANGGGSGLQLSVVGGETQPETPNDGTIWINTDTAIGDYQLRGVAPTTRANGSALQDGDVWLPTTAINGASISLDSAHTVVIALHDARQYRVTTGWEKRSAHAYANDSWAVISYVLYADGYQDTTFDQEMPAVFEVSSANTITNYAYLNTNAFDVAGIKSVYVECSDVYISFYNAAEMILKAELLSTEGDTLAADSKAITTETASNETFALAVPADAVGTVTIKVTLSVRVWNGQGASRTGYATINNVYTDSV